MERHCRKLAAILFLILLLVACTDYDHDIIWADGYMVMWPEGTKR